METTKIDFDLLHQEVSATIALPSSVEALILGFFHRCASCTFVFDNDSVNESKSLDSEEEDSIYYGERLLDEILSSCRSCNTIFCSRECCELHRSSEQCPCEQTGMCRTIRKGCTQCNQLVCSECGFRCQTCSGYIHFGCGDALDCDGERCWHCGTGSCRDIQLWFTAIQRAETIKHLMSTLSEFVLEQPLSVGLQDNPTIELFLQVHQTLQGQPSQEEHYRALLHPRGHNSFYC